MLQLYHFIALIYRKEAGLSKITVYTQPYLICKNRDMFRLIVCSRHLAGYRTLKENMIKDAAHSLTDFVIKTFSLYRLGTAVAQWIRCCATNRKVAVSIAAGVRGFFIDIKSFRSHYGPGVDSASNRNEYQEHLLGVKAAGA